MVFHRSLSDSKSTQVSGTLLSILAVLNNAVVWMVSTGPSTSKSPRTFNNPLLTVPKVPITIDIIVTFMFHNFSHRHFHVAYFFSSLAMSRDSFLFSFSFSFTLWSVGTVKSLIGQVLFLFFLFFFFFFFHYHYVWSSCRDSIIHLYLKIPEKIMRPIFCVVHISFVRMVEFKLLAQFPIDLLPQPIVSCLLLLFRLLSAFAYYVVDRFIIITIIINSLEFFTSADADGLSLGLEWQQVSSSLPDSSQYSGLSQ